MILSSKFWMFQHIYVGENSPGAQVIVANQSGTPVRFLSSKGTKGIRRLNPEEYCSTPESREDPVIESEALSNP